MSRADGGIFEAELALQRHLAALPGMQVDVVGLRDGFTDADADRWLPLRPQTAEVRGPAGFGFAPGLAALMSANVDLAYGAVLWKYPAWALLDWQKLTGKQVVLAPHGSLDAWALRNSRWKKRVASLLFKDRQLRAATCFRALCGAEADSIRALGLTQRIEVVPNGVVLPELSTAKRPSGPKRLLFLGRIHPKKGLANALRAWLELGHEKSGALLEGWELVVAGWDQGGHEAELKRLCGDRKARVVFAGPAFGVEKEALLRSAEAFVLPSFSEGLPMSVLEAWSHGLPVAMTPECHLPEGFDAGAALEIFNSGNDVAGLVRGLRTLIEMSDADRLTMGRRGRQLVEERFTWPIVAERMRGVLESVL
ncbi:MAG: glycosyltransferase [Verrucomicrobiota bacterium]